MAADMPDPKSLRSWDEAFQYPIPTVRGIEKKLRRDVDENHEKLRTLVGASYRDLLGTARTIVDVNSQMARVETLLVDIGRRSDSRILDKIAANYTRLERSTKSQDEEHLIQASQLSVLQRCLRVIARLLRTHDSTLLAAKMLVIGRLLQKNLSLSPEAPPLVETLATRLAVLRQRLLRHIDRRLAKKTSNPAALVEDMTAFSLATSSTPTDVLRHFQHLRTEAICIPYAQDRQTVNESVLRRLQLFLHTLRDIKAIFPSVLAASLKVLGARPLLEEPSITRIDELDFDIHLRWLPKDVKNYVPYTRHDELSLSKVDHLLSHWLKQISSVMIGEIQNDIKMESHLPTVVHVRKEALQLWLSSKRNVRGLDWNVIFNGLRVPFVKQVNHLVEKACSDLQSTIARSITSALNDDSMTSGRKTVSLWDFSTVSMDIGAGASEFRKAITDRRLGKQELVTQLIAGYGSSVQLLDQVRAVVKSMKDTRWDDDDEGDDDDPTSLSPSHILSKDDPNDIQKYLVREIVRAVNHTELSISSIMTEHHLDCSHPTSPGLFVLRAARELRFQLPQLLDNLDPDVSDRPFCEDVVRQIQSSIVASVSRKAGSLYERQLSIFAQSRYQVQTLWVGNPSLPVQPTPGTFRHLRIVVREMESLGQDLWSPDIIAILRDSQKTFLAQQLNDAIVRLERQSDAFEETNKNSVAMHQHQPNDDVQAGVSKDETIAEAVGITSDHPNPSADDGAAEELHKVESKLAAEGTENDYEVQSENVASKEPLPADQTDENDGNGADATPQPVRGDYVPDGDQDVQEHSTDTATFEERNQQNLVDEGSVTPRAPGTPPISAKESEIEPATTITIPPRRVNPYQTKAKLTQLLFDALYLSQAMSFNTSFTHIDGTEPSSDSSSLPSVIGALITKTSLDQTGLARVERSAREYWRRTYLLFGLLVGE